MERRERGPVLPVEDFDQDVIENGPEAETTDGEDKNGERDGEDQAALGAANAAAGEGADFRIRSIVRLHNFGFQHLTIFPFGIGLDVGRAENGPAMTTTTICGTTVVVHAPAVDVMPSGIFGADDDILARRKRFFAQGAGLAQERRLFVD